jgi:signal transduction histidine kinase/CheY-like chemotaxis protein
MTDRSGGVFRSSRLSWNLLAVVLPAAILMVATLAWLQYGAARRQILHVVDDEMRLLAEKTAGNIDDLLDQRYRDLFTLSESPLIADYYRSVEFRLHEDAESYREEFEQHLRDFAERSRVYARILYLDGRGRTICRIAPGETPRTAPDFSAEDFIAAQRAPGGWWISPIQKLSETSPIMYYAKPIRDETGKFEGMLVLGYDLNHLRGILEGIQISRHGRTYIGAPDGIILEGRRPAASAGLLTARHELKRRPWTVFIEAPRADFLAPLNAFRIAAALIAFGGCAAFIAILLLLVRSITRPIEALVVAARAIGAGDLSHRTQATRTDELGELSAAFNEMAEHLDLNRRQAAQLQSQLIQAEKLSAVGQLIAAVAHELNNPLAAVSGHVQLSQRDVAEDRIKRRLGRAYDNILRCRKVVDNLLFFVRKNGPERRKIDLNTAAHSALDLLEYRLIKTEDVLVMREFDAAPLGIQGDFQQIVQILVNLIGNACDAMDGVVRYPEGKRLSIRTGRGNGQTYIEIEDNGTGFDPGLRETIFMPFFTTKEAGRGTGLGLSISRQIAREHGGELVAESRPGLGSVFRLNLPLYEKEEPSTGTNGPDDCAAVPGKRVLVADDEKDVAELIASLLREDGDEAIVVHRGEEALALLDRERFDLVVSDVQMSRGNGIDIYEALAAKGALSAVNILFVTGDVLNPKVLRFFHQTRSPYVAKPFDIHELKQAMRRMLERPRR